MEKNRRSVSSSVLSDEHSEPPATAAYNKSQRSTILKAIVLGTLAILAACSFRFGMPRYRKWQEEQSKPPVARKLEAIEKIPPGTLMMEVVAQLPCSGIVITKSGAPLNSLPKWHTAKLTKRNDHFDKEMGQMLKLPGEGRQSVNDVVVALELPLGLVDNPNPNVYLPIDAIPPGWRPSKTLLRWASLGFDDQGRLIGRGGYLMNPDDSKRRFRD